MNRRRWLAIGVAGVALVLALGGVSLANSSSKGDKTERAKYAKLYRERLAARLGVDAAALDAARKGAIEDVIAQALKDGAITPTQAARLREKLATEGLDEGFPGFGLGKGHGNHGLRAKGRIFNAALEAVLDKLNMTRGELKQSLRSGMTLEQIAKAHGTTLAALGKAAADAAKPILDEKVKAGDITRAQADALLERLRSGELLMLHGHHKLGRAA
jgi:polyhydroxyalkanoate synthesis regulator phasin